MTLSIDLPTYDLKIPSTGQYVKIRPFTVKEEKLLLMAAESNDGNDIINTTRQVVQGCILSEDVNVDKLPFFDVDYLFIALRAKSIGESIEVKFTCNNLVDGQKCGSIFPAKIDITNSKIIKNDLISKNIDLGKNIKVKMKYPGYSVIKALVGSDKNIDKQIHLIANSIEYISDKDKVYTTKDITHDEILKFVEGLTREQYDKLKVFVNNFPSFVITTEAVCPKCGFHHNLEYKEFISFFV